MGRAARPNVRPKVRDWGRLTYAAALARQEDLFRRRASGEICDVIVSVEHPPTITLGRHAPEADLLVPAAELARRGVSVARCDRGGRATYHGPGQAVVYPIVDIGGLGLGAREWVSLLEEAVLEGLAAHGIRGQRHPGEPGIWAAGGKIASLGLRIRRGISTHGLAVNVGLDVAAFGDIVVCGSARQAVTTMAAEAGRRLDCRRVGALLCGIVADKIERIT